jgi:exodeoxyribonuclease VII large subunit
MNNDPIYSPTDFVAVFNQTLEFAYPSVLLQGELADYRVSKGKWLYFKIKDEHASVQCFGTVMQLRHELQEGMMVQLRAHPRLHPLYNFSLQVQFIQPVGEGAIKKAADILREKLQKEGLFDPAKKRPLPYPPKKVGLITSEESAAYRDFTKVLAERWPGVEIELYSVQVQGEPAVNQIVQAIEFFSATNSPPEVIVLTRGGGSMEDLEAFSTEPVTRAVAASKVPTIVAVGHEVDVSLAELAADLRASTPSNAAELLVPSRQDALQQLATLTDRADSYLLTTLTKQKQQITDSIASLVRAISLHLKQQRQDMKNYRQLLELLHPRSALERGYAIVWNEDGAVVRSSDTLSSDDKVTIELADARIKALIQSTHKKKE